MTHDDVLDALRSVDPVDGVDLRRVDRRALDALRVGITMTDRGAAGPARRRRWSRRGVTAGALAAVLVGGGAAYAGVQQQWFGGFADGVNCWALWNEPATGAPMIGGADLTGDPVADCETYRAEAELPPLSDPVAFEYEGMVYVMPRSQVPEGATLRGPATARDAAARELEASLRDWVDGGMSWCADPGSAEAFARSELERLGLDDWQVQVDPTPDPPHPGSPCADMTTGLTPRTVTILPDRASDIAEESGPSLSALRDALRAGIADTCVSVGDAETVVEQALDGEQHFPTTVVLVDESADCARVDLEVGGSIQVTVHGPTQARG
jgi:hypothetical protein